MDAQHFCVLSLRTEPPINKKYGKRVTFTKETKNHDGKHILPPLFVAFDNIMIKLMNGYFNSPASFKRIIEENVVYLPQILKLTDDIILRIKSIDEGEKIPILSSGRGSMRKIGSNWLPTIQWFSKIIKIVMDQ